MSSGFNTVSVSVLVQSRFYYYLWIGLQQLLSGYIPPFPFELFIQRIVNSVLAEKLVFDKTEYRTPKWNEAIELLGRYNRGFGGNKKREDADFSNSSLEVPRRRLELLSLAAYAPQTYVYTNSTTWAFKELLFYKGAQTYMIFGKNQ